MNSKTKEFVLKATDGLIGSAVNTVLWFIYLQGASIGVSKSSYGAHQMFRGAHEALEEFNYESFKQIISKLRRQGYIKKAPYSKTELEITKIGKERIAALLPVYQTTRPWDGYLYLISYDIPEIRHTSRDLLRRYLKTVGCARLQESLWITPYNPRKLLDDFMRERGIDGTVLVSKLGKDGAVGEEGLQGLLERVYGLQSLNDRYKDFISLASQKSIQKFQLAVEFHHIIVDDPQLPFELLPKNWSSERANSLYLKLCTI